MWQGGKDSFGDWAGSVVAGGARGLGGKYSFGDWAGSVVASIYSNDIEYFSPMLQNPQRIGQQPFALFYILARIKLRLI